MSLPRPLQQLVDTHEDRKYEIGEEYDFVWVRFLPVGPKGFSVKVAQSSDEVKPSI